MAKATITLEDASLDESGNPLFNARIDYEDGFNAESDAQQWGHWLMQQLDQVAKPVGDEEIIGNAPSSRVSREAEAGNAN